MSFLTRHPGSLAPDHLCSGAQRTQAPQCSGQPAECLCWPKDRRSEAPIGSATEKWRSDYEVVTTTTDVSYVNAEIASAITDN
jgi:hypothetical protein